MTTAEILDDLEIDYPSSDGVEMGESTIHMRTMMLLLQGLEEFFKNRADVFCASDLFWYWEKGNKSACVAPDAMVIPGVGKHARRSFRSFHEKGAIPSVAFEIVSDDTWKKDMVDKVEKYASLAVREYFVFDPLGTYQKPQLKGYRLRRGKYERIASRKGRLSSLMGFDLAPEESMLRLFHSSTGTPVLTPQELFEEEHRRNEELAAENARLQELLKLRRKTNGNGH